MESVAPDDTPDTNHPRSHDLGAGQTPEKNLTLGERIHVNGLGVDQRCHLGEGHVATMIGARRALRAPGIIHRRTPGFPETMSLIHLSTTRLPTGGTT